MKQSLFSIVMSVLLSSCMPLTSSGSPPVIYVLHAPSANTQKAKITYIIAVPEPEVPIGFDNNKINLYLNNGRRLDYYAHAEWPDHLGRVLQDVIIQSAQSVPGLLAVAPNSEIVASAQLFIKVYDFEPIYAASAETPPKVKVSMNFRLMSLYNRKILFNGTYSQEAWATKNTQTNIIATLESLLANIDVLALKKISHGTKM